MAPILKDTDTAATTTATPGNAVNKPAPAGDPARSQPVALEIPVSVNGARTIEGSDKREPFSESTQTVLVFGNGAVIRLASALASGQLVFLTNEKTKKEVVCQVVKSKNYRTVTGYVELEFTEPAPGFWGMRFPAAAVSPTPPTPPALRPAVPAHAAPIPTAPAAPVTPKVTPPPAPVAVKPIAPAPTPVVPLPIPSKPAVIPTPPAAIVTPEPPKAPAPVTAAPSIPPAPVAPLAAVHVAPAVMPPTASVPPAPFVEHISPAGKHESSPAATHNYAKEIAAIFSVPQAPAKSAPPPATPMNANSGPNSSPKQLSTEELKLQAARLQEQLSAMLFTETPGKPASPAPLAMVTPDVAKKVFELTQVKVVPIPAPAPPIKITSSVVKPIATSLDAEEVQIPAWLAPLARNTETAVSESPANSDSSAVGALSPRLSTASITSDVASVEEPAHREQPTMFGGQLAIDSSAAPTEATSSGSNKGLFIGLAAAALLAVGGAVWYAKQPGNVLSGSSAAKPVASQPANFEPTPATPETVAKPQPTATAPTSKPAPTSVIPAALQPPSDVVPPVSNSPVSKVAKDANPIASPSANVHPAPPIEQPKKPSLGDVRLATPVVNHAASVPAPLEVEPTVASEIAPSADPLAGMASGHSKEPAVPTRVGGDVKQARLIKSVPPVYPQLAKTQHITGNIQIDALIDARGNVTTMKVLSGPPSLHQAALTAVKQWKYEPALLDGNPTSMHLTVTVQFRIQ